MSVKETHLLLEKDGKMTTLTKYILVKPVGDGYELETECEIGDLLSAMFILWELIKENIANLSDQDIYELCIDFDLDYEHFKGLMRNE